MTIKEFHYCNHGVMLPIAAFVLVLLEDNQHVLYGGVGICKKHICSSNSRSIPAEPKSVADVIGIHLCLILDITSHISEIPRLLSPEARDSGLSLTPVSCTNDKTAVGVHCADCHRLLHQDCRIMRSNISNSDCCWDRDHGGQLR